MIRYDEVIRIGKLTRTHGTAGELQCQMENALWEDAEATFLILDIDHLLTPYRVLEYREKGCDSLLFVLSGIENEQSALRLVGADVYMLRRDIEEESDDASYVTWQSLKGMHVLDIDQGDLGEVTDVDESTANTLLTLTDGRLIPIHEDFIADIDTVNYVLRIRLPYHL